VSPFTLGVRDRNVQGPWWVNLSKTIFIMIFYKSSWKPSWSFLGNNKLVKIILFSKIFFLIKMLIYFQIFMLCSNQFLNKFWTPFSGFRFKWIEVNYLEFSPKKLFKKLVILMFFRIHTNMKPHERNNTSAKPK
jgi:hypothetical protein